MIVKNSHIPYYHSGIIIFLSPKVPHLRFTMCLLLFLICIYYCNLGNVTSWHGYNQTAFQQIRNIDHSDHLHSHHNKRTHLNGSDQCLDYYEATRPYPSSFISKLGLWPGLMTDYDLEYGETLFGSKEMLELIYINQNPENCETAQYLVSSGWPFGFGSRIHMEGVGLSIGLNIGRVFLYHPDGDNVHWETKIPFCRDIAASLECFYERLSKCTIADALIGTGTDVNGIPNRYMSDFQESFLSLEGQKALKDSLQNVKSFNLMMHTGGSKWDVTTYIPHAVRKLINCSPVNNEAKHYMWRAVTSAYFTRPNYRTLNLLASYSNLAISDYNECIAMFVRHGDKGIEMKLIDFTTYRETAEMMWANQLTPTSRRNYRHTTSNNLTNSNEIRDHSRTRGGSHSKLSTNGTLFITTEDPAVLEEAELWGKETNWGIAFTNLFDRGSQTAYKTWDEIHRKGYQPVHDNLEYISMLLNLQYALRCETWVCTLASNSCRIIDELRITIGGKANRNYADLSAETCKRPPCIGDGQYRYDS